MPTTARSLASTTISQPAAQHALPACAEELEGRVTPTQRFDQLRAIHFAGGFASGHENLHGFIVIAGPYALPVRSSGGRAATPESVPLGATSTLL
jgi:hypothetical protein